MTPPPREVWHFPARHVGADVLVYDSLPSTNDLAAELAADPANAGRIVLADVQTAGRGQHGRAWASEPGRSILASVLLFPPAELNRAVVLTAWAAVAVAEAAAELANVRCQVKWPNDLLVGGKKVCGILIERRRGTVVGVGLNLNQTADDFARMNLPDATSLGFSAGVNIDQKTAIGVLVRHLDDGYSRLLAGERAGPEAIWKSRFGLLGRHVVAELTDGTVEAGRLSDMGFDGVELDLGDGAFRVLVPEAVRHLREG